VALRMIEEAEREGRLKPGDVIIEPTSGNTGVGLCMAAAIKGYKVIITMPLKMSGEKLNTMKALGAEILRTPTEAGWNDEDSHISLAKDLEAASNGRAHVLDQYLNSGNPLAHFQGTAQELLQQCGNKLDVVVIASGTGGTVTGIGRGIKEVLPDCKIVAVDPVGSLLAQPESMNERKRLHGYQIEGIGYDFIPTVLDRSLIDEWVKIDDQEALSAARGAVKHEGLLVGGSSGSAIAGALAYIQDQGEALHGKRVAVLCADGVRNYMSKFMDDAWMAEHDMPLDLDFKHSILKKTGEFEPNPDAAAAAASASASDEWGASNSPSVTLLARALANRVAELEKAHASGDISDALFNERKAKLEARMAPPLSK
jgi:cystathionine beta-synthase